MFNVVEQMGSGVVMALQVRWLSGCAVEKTKMGLCEFKKQRWVILWCLRLKQVV